MRETSSRASQFAVLCLWAWISTATAFDEQALRQKLQHWFERPEVLGLLWGGLEGPQLDAFFEARKLPPESAPLAVELLAGASDEDKLAAICLAGFLLREHPVPSSLKSRAREVVVAELNRRPLKGSRTTAFAIRFLAEHGEIADLQAIEPYIVHGEDKKREGPMAWKAILARAGRDSPPVPNVAAQNRPAAATDANSTVSPSSLGIAAPSIAPESTAKAMEPPVATHDRRLSGIAVGAAIASLCLVILAFRFIRQRRRAGG